MSFNVSTSFRKNSPKKRPSTERAYGNIYPKKGHRLPGFFAQCKTYIRLIYLVPHSLKCKHPNSQSCMMYFAVSSSSKHRSQMGVVESQDSGMTGRGGASCSVTNSTTVLGSTRTTTMFPNVTAI